MAVSNYERVGKALELLRDGLAPYVEREFRNAFKKEYPVEVAKIIGDDRINAKKPVSEWDAAALLVAMWDTWNKVFSSTLGHTDRSMVSEMRDWRNKWAHQGTFSGDDTYRALDSVERILKAVSAPQAEEVEKMKNELLRLRFDEQARAEKRKSAGAVVESGASTNLKPWRDVVAPHDDVAKGVYQQAEFAADLWQVYLGEGSDEYRDPSEFFKRTYLTESLKSLLTNAIERLSGKGGDPVVQLQTNFGGGKTHSMLALYHLFSGIDPKGLAGIDAVLEETKGKTLPSVNRVVIVGNRVSPGNPSIKDDGTEVRTIWGEIAWQLGYSAGGANEAKKAFKLVQKDDERATNPGDALRELFKQYGPCLILIDEWVAYARQLHDQGDLPGGSFETQFTFAQTLTETAKSAKNCLLLISLPASDTTGSPHAIAEDSEVGGERGRAALDRLRNVVGRVESSWRPATAEESFEIVRRRLFKPLKDKEQFVARDTVAQAFSDLYQSQSAEFPLECKSADYEKRLKAAYPIHPEVFDRLYTDWSSLAKFQRTRGVLRLMAAVIHALWKAGDKNPLIMPSTLPIDEQRVKFELTRYLSDNWIPVIEKDVDGPNSLTSQMDSSLTNIGKISAARRVGRTIYLGSAPTLTAAHKGVEDRQIKLGCVMPGESTAIFGDALRRLASSATYLYQDGNRYWYSTQPTVTKLAEDRAEQIKRTPDKVDMELEKRVRDDLRRVAGFSAVHPMPKTGADIPDDLEARLVVLSHDHAYSKEPKCRAEQAALGILESAGKSPRIYRNVLVFLAADKVAMQDLDESICKYLAWESIIGDKENLNLGPQQIKQAEARMSEAEREISLRIPETYKWLLVPAQGKESQSPVSWQAIQLRGNEPLANRAEKKLKNEELLVFNLGSTILRKDLDGVPLWRGNHVEVRQLVEDYARYLYLPRIASPSVLIEAIKTGLGLLTWRDDSFAYAESYDEENNRYRGLRVSPNIAVSAESRALLVQPAIAEKQFGEDDDKGKGKPTPDPNPPDGRGGSGEPPSGGDKPKPTTEIKKRFHGTVTLDPMRVGKDAGRIADEVISHLTGLVDADVTVTLEIEAKIPSGAPDNVVRTVTENCRTLKFTDHGFEKE